MRTLGSNPAFRIVVIATKTCVVYFEVVFVMYLLAGACTDAYPIRARSAWLSERLGGAASIGVVYASAVFIIVLVDLIVRYAVHDEVPADLAYYPRWQHARGWMHSAAARITLTIGLVCLAADYANFELKMFAARQAHHAVIGPSEPLFGVLVCAWCLCWLADCFTRPRHETVMVAAVFQILSVVF